MTARRTSLVAALALCLSLAGPAATAQARTTAEAVGLPIIVESAEQRAAAEYPAAKFHGARAKFGTPLWDPRDVRAWSVDFYPGPGGPKWGFSYLYSAEGRFQSTAAWRKGVGNDPVAKFTMTQFEAFDLVRAAGYRTHPFTQLYLSQPRVLDPEPIYYFCFDHEVVGVGATTSKVFKNLFRC
ncbi:MAG: hypothetical protein HOV94_19425 [Saccharothrix sp.]|nr:hypothetical protein [Saccharothrix sp.]